jgi:hypothetical protein
MGKGVVMHDDTSYSSVTEKLQVKRLRKRKRFDKRQPYHWTTLRDNEKRDLYDFLIYSV